MVLDMSSLSGTSSGSEHLYLQQSGVRTRFASQSADSPRQDPGVVAKFAEIWGTEELLASYGESLALPEMMRGHFLADAARRLQRIDTLRQQARGRFQTMAARRSESAGP